jgi:hypothetical protein
MVVPGDQVPQDREIPQQAQQIHHVSQPWCQVPDQPMVVVLHRLQQRPEDHIPQFPKKCPEEEASHLVKTFNNFEKFH